MKPDAYIKTILTIITLLLAIVTLKPVFNPDVAVAQGATGKSPSASMRWEYKTIYRQRGFKNLDDDHLKQAEFGDATEWLAWSEDGKEIPLPVNIDTKLAALGAQGWELVTAYPRSDLVTERVIGRTSACSYGNFGTCNWDAALKGFALNGATTADLWILKRPKP